ncbi:MAG TPA: glycerol-3-phosphate transporter permease, partial [Methylomirabilota bacterium]|nr:glycerol-3-phosphate transporter permease [Methylomirabilota bacterium]
MQKRVVFQQRALAYLLVAPQLLITLVFFIWPAGQALLQSFLVQDAFGLSTEFVWFENFVRLFGDENYLHVFRVTVVFALATALGAMATALLLAVMADRVLKTAVGYRTVLVAPYAV